MACNSNTDIENDNESLKSSDISSDNYNSHKQLSDSISATSKQNGEQARREDEQMSEQNAYGRRKSGTMDVKTISTSPSMPQKLPEELPRRNFQIPRKIKERKGLFQNLPVESREFDDLVKLLSSFYLESNSRGSFSYTKACFIHNELLEKEFIEKKRELKQNGRTDAELEESYAFLFSEKDKVQAICEKGLSVGHSRVNTLGSPTKGVYLSKYSDLLQINPFEPGASGDIIVFKIMKGKMKTIYESGPKNPVEPSQKFDSHVSKNASKVSSLLAYRAFEHTQQYLFEFAYDELKSRPRHVCPYAVLSFQYRGKDTGSSMNRISSSLIEGNRGRRRYTVWSGTLTNKGKELLQVSVRSSSLPLLPFRMPDSLDVSTAMHLDAVKRKLPALLSWDTFYGRREVLKYGMYCSLFEVVSKNKPGNQNMAGLLQKLEKDKIVLVKPLVDKGFLFLLSSAQMQISSERSRRMEKGLHALFIFQDPRLITKYSSPAPPARHPDDNVTLRRLEPFLPALHHALQRLRAHPPKDLGAAVERQAVDYMSQLRGLGNRSGQGGLTHFRLPKYRQDQDDRPAYSSSGPRSRLGADAVRSYLQSQAAYQLPTAHAHAMLRGEGLNTRRRPPPPQAAAASTPTATTPPVAGTSAVSNLTISPAASPAGAEDEHSPLSDWGSQDKQQTSRQASAHVAQSNGGSQRASKHREGGAREDSAGGGAQYGKEQMEKLLQVIQMHKRTLAGPKGEEQEVWDTAGLKRKLEDAGGEQASKYLRTSLLSNGELGRAPGDELAESDEGPSLALAKVIDSIGVRDTDLRDRTGSGDASSESSQNPPGVPDAQRLLKLLVTTLNRAIAGNSGAAEALEQLSTGALGLKIGGTEATTEVADLDLRKRPKEEEPLQDYLEDQAACSMSSMEVCSPASTGEPLLHSSATFDNPDPWGHPDKAPHPVLEHPSQGKPGDRLLLCKAVDSILHSELQCLSSHIKHLMDNVHIGYTPHPSPVKPTQDPNALCLTSTFSPFVSRHVKPLPVQPYLKTLSEGISHVIAHPHAAPVGPPPGNGATGINSTAALTVPAPDACATPYFAPAPGLVTVPPTPSPAALPIPPAVNTAVMPPFAPAPPCNPDPYLASSQIPVPVAPYPAPVAPMHVTSPFIQGVSAVPPVAPTTFAAAPAASSLAPVPAVASLAPVEHTNFLAPASIVSPGSLAPVTVDPASFLAPTGSLVPVAPTSTVALATVAPAGSLAPATVASANSMAPAADPSNFLATAGSLALTSFLGHAGSLDSASSFPPLAQVPVDALAPAPSQATPVPSSKPILGTVKEQPKMAATDRSDSQAAIADSIVGAPVSLSAAAVPQTALPGPLDTAPAPLAAPANPTQAANSLISQIKPDIFLSLVQMVQKNTLKFYIHMAQEEEDQNNQNQLCSEIKEYLKSFGNSECNPQGFLENNSHLDKLMVIIQNEDIAMHVHKIPGLVSLKKLPSVSFAGVDSLDDVKNRTYNELFVSGGLVVSDESILNPNLITLDKLQRLLKFLEEQSSIWQWKVHCKTQKKLKEQSRLNSDTMNMLNLLTSYQKRHLVEFLPYHECDAPTRTAPDLDCLVKLQAQHTQHRHIVFLTERKEEMSPLFSSHGILVANMEDLLDNFVTIMSYIPPQKVDVSCSPSKVEMLCAPPKVEMLCAPPKVEMLCAPPKVEASCLPPKVEVSCLPPKVEASCLPPKTEVPYLLPKVEVPCPHPEVEVPCLPQKEAIPCPPPCPPPNEEMPCRPPKEEIPCRPPKEEMPCLPLDMDVPSPPQDIDVPSPPPDMDYPSPPPSINMPSAPQKMEISSPTSKVEMLSMSQMVEKMSSPLRKVELPSGNPKQEVPSPVPKLEVHSPVPKMEMPSPTPKVEIAVPLPKVERPSPPLPMEILVSSPKVEMPSPLPKMEMPSPVPIVPSSPAEAEQKNVHQENLQDDDMSLDSEDETTTIAERLTSVADVVAIPVGTKGEQPSLQPAPTVQDFHSAFPNVHSKGSPVAFTPTNAPSFASSPKLGGDPLAPSFGVNLHQSFLSPGSPQWSPFAGAAASSNTVYPSPVHPPMAFPQQSPMNHHTQPLQSTSGIAKVGGSNGNSSEDGPPGVIPPGQDHDATQKAETVPGAGTPQVVGSTANSSGKAAESMGLSAAPAMGYGWGHGMGLPRQQQQPVSLQPGYKGGPVGVSMDPPLPETPRVQPPLPPIPAPPPPPFSIAPTGTTHLHSIGTGGLGVTADNNSNQGSHTLVNTGPETQSQLMMASPTNRGGPVYRPHLPPHGRGGLPGPAPPHIHPPPHGHPHPGHPRHANPMGYGRGGVQVAPPLTRPPPPPPAMDIAAMHAGFRGRGPVPMRARPGRGHMRGGPNPFPWGPPVRGAPPPQDYYPDYTYP